MKISAIKRELAQNVLALHNLISGDSKPAVAALQLGDLPADKLHLGLRSRVESGYRFLACDPACRHNVSAQLTASAACVLGGSKLAPSTREYLTSLIPY